MKRRSILTAMGTLAATSAAPGFFGMPSFVRSANASVSQRKLLNARALVVDQIGYQKPTTLPQVISIFLYGGPSELGANLTNIEEINTTSLNKYPTNLLPSNANTIYTPNGFWGGGNGAGGDIMERMIAAGRMSVYRTINRLKDNSRAHRPSIFSNLTGMIGEDDLRPGIAASLSNILQLNNVISENSLFPLVSFEGNSLVFNKGDLVLPSYLAPLTLDDNFRNPYSRSTNNSVGASDEVIETLAAQVSTASGERFSKVLQAFAKRAEISGFIAELNSRTSDTTLPADPDAPPPEAGESPTLITYPNNSFGRRLRAAVNLVSNNPDTLFVSLGSDGLGGWDDHNDAIAEYSNRMRGLMTALDAAAKHLEALGKGNVIITVFGDFGRNANLNNSLGWDHGNNQNLFMVGAGPSAGASIDDHFLGKIVGKTEVKGDPAQNRQYTYPTDDSYQCEPFAIASTIYKYFGIQNPEILTGEAPINEKDTPNEWINPNA